MTDNSMGLYWQDKTVTPLQEFYQALINTVHTTDSY